MDNDKNGKRPVYTWADQASINPEHESWNGEGDWIVQSIEQTKDNRGFLVGLRNARFRESLQAETEKPSTADTAGVFTSYLQSLPETKSPLEAIWHLSPVGGKAPSDAYFLCNQKTKTLLHVLRDEKDPLSFHDKQRRNVFAANEYSSSTRDFCNFSTNPADWWEIDPVNF